MLPPSFEVEFKGGPIGGERRWMKPADFPGRRLQVPVLDPWVGFITAPPNAFATPPMSEYHTEEYELDFPRREWNEEGRYYREIYTARWINPNRFLIADNKKMKARLAELETAGQVLDGLRTLLK